MARKSENVFRDKVHKYLPMHGMKPAPGCPYRMKNNNPYTAGIADDWYSGNAGDLWIEYKYLRSVPIRAVTKPYELLEHLQVVWLNDRHDEGRQVAVIIGCPTGGVILQSKDWMKDISAKEFVPLIQSASDLAKWIKSKTMASSENS